MKRCKYEEHEEAVCPRSVERAETALFKPFLSNEKV
jgi:hypothetical protein